MTLPVFATEDAYTQRTTTAGEVCGCKPSALEQPTDRLHTKLNEPAR